MKITSLIENTSSSDGIAYEHGLSLFIETKRHKILFDMGQTDAFAANAERLGIDLASADTAVLSHGHYDHGGGLARFLELNKTAPVYINPYAFEPHYHGADRYIGLDPALADDPRIISVPDRFIIDDGIALHSCNDRVKKQELGSFGLDVMTDGQLIPDSFRHEQYLLIEENGRRILISGCSHKGILNIMEWFLPDVLVGGFHFSGLPLDSTLAGYAETLDKYGAEYYTCHCTGQAQYDFMNSYMSSLHYLSGGECIILW